jgi:Xaa-Pro aminopeptidase
MNYKNRIKRAQNEIEKWQVDALYVTAPKDISYFTGQDLSKGILIIFKTGAKLLVDGRYFQACKETAPCEVLLSSAKALSELIKSAGKIRLGFDQEHETYKAFCGLQKIAQESGATLTGLNSPVMQLRAIKDSDELKKIEAACSLCSLGFDYIVTLIKTGITEKALATELEIFWKKKGADSLAFSPIIAFGKNSAKPHYRAKDVKLKNNEVILIDIGVVLDGYNSDMTRMVFFGNVDPQIEKIAQVVLEAQSAAIQACKAGVSASELDMLAKNIIKKSGFGEYILHGLGHGVGMDIHEKPTLKKDEQIEDVILQPGMVVTIEPGIYLPDIGGVRIEDMLIVQEHASLNLTNRPQAPLSIIL